MSAQYHSNSLTAHSAQSRTRRRIARRERPALESLECRQLLSGIEEFGALLSNNTNGGPAQVTIADGNLWFTEPTANTVGVFDMTGDTVADQLTLSDQNGDPPGITATSGTNAAIFFTLSSGGQLGVGDSTNPSQSPEIFNFFSSGGAVSATSGITSDGANLWLTGLAASDLLEVEPNPLLPSLAQNPISVPSSLLGFENFDSTITTGPNGVLFFTEATVGSGGAITASGIGSYNPSNGDFSQYLLPTTGGVQEPFGLALGSDGNIWFTAAVPNSGSSGFGASYVGAINPSTMSLLTELQAPNGSQPNGITVGPDHDIYFTETGAGAIGTVVIDSSNSSDDALGTPISIPTSGSPGGVLSHPAPAGITTASDGTMWFADSGGAIGELVLPTHLAVTTEPPLDVSAGSTFGVAVSDEFADGVVDTQFTGNVGLATTASPTSPIADVAASNGVATFTGLSLGVGTYQLIATSSIQGTPASVTTSSFTVVNGPANQLVVTSQPTTPVTAGSPFTIVITDDYTSGPTDTEFNGSVSLALASNPGTPVATVSASNGVATFTGLTLDTVGSDYVYQATGGDLAVSTSAISVVPGAASSFKVTTEPPTQVTAGEKFGFVVTAYDAYNNVATGFSGTLTAAILHDPTGGLASLGGSLNAPATNGVATFSQLTLTKAAVGYTLEASNGGASAASTGSVTVSAAAASQLVVIAGPPASVPADGTFGLTVEALDPYNNVAPTFNGSVSVAIAPGANPGSGTLAGGTNVTATSGVASFSGLSINNMANGYQLQVTGDGFTVMTSSINVTAPIPTIVLAQIVKTQKHNKKGKAVGKPVFGGFSFEFSQPMGTSAATGSEYTVDLNVIKKIKHKSVTILKPVSFTTSYNSSTNTVTLGVSAKQTFPKGGQITIAGTPPGGVESSLGAFLNNGASATFTITPKVKGIVPG
jgi:streptogramin lyase